ncbi:hypothetical protein [Flagellimonas meridianipacifica]|uniref:Tetratricopeptide repeat protein n=1 Tax=Flagellimonas meridianipacifica TaxID=1080225 RepID=A0A2T0MFH8_9FLAO|nr:hypothetical protein [Allomuricauda pacifica]PRX56330.1 hypothetical protein CLV81_0325 [Allomuricauda pacifica]
MNVSDFLHILRKSNTILSPQQTRELEDIIAEYPYFQAARALHLKGLKNLDSYKYNSALKATAAHTTDRDVLFDYITSNEFVQNNIADSIAGRAPKLEEKEIVSEEIEPNPDTEIFIPESEEKPLPQNIQDAEQILDPKLFASKEPKPRTEVQVGDEEDAETQLGIGKPLSFTKSEKHSFVEWLQLTSDETTKAIDVVEPIEIDKKRKFELLDKFIENNPKIVPKEESQARVDIKDSVRMDKNELMTETLAKVYLEQKKYKKAIQAFKILSLKYPEKSGFFADQIRAVKKLQKEKK